MIYHIIGHITVHDGACLILWPMCCHTELPWGRYRALHPPRHSIQTRGRPVVVLSIDVERHTGIHNYNFNVLGKTRSGLLPRPSNHTSKRSTYSADMVVVSQKLDRKWNVPTGSWTRDLWWANLLHYPLAHSCFSFSRWPTKAYVWDVPLYLYLIWCR